MRAKLLSIFGQYSHLGHNMVLTRSLSSHPLTKVSRSGGVETIVLSSPATRNALSLEMMETLLGNINAAGDDQEVRAIVIRGEGKVFSAGHNLKEMTQEQGRDYIGRIFETCERLMLTLTQVPVPVITAVTGLATAAGCQMVAASDISVAGPHARFSTPGASVGLFCHTPGIPLARRVPRAVSGYMLLTGEPINAREAYTAGLVSRLVEDDDLVDVEVDKICAAISSKPKAVISLGKKFYQEQLEMSLKDAYSAGSQVMMENLAYRDAQEGIEAFKQKRRPVFCHTDEVVF